MHVSAQRSAEDVCLQSYKLAWRGCCCPPVQPLVCDASGTWPAWAGTTSSLGCGTFAPAMKQTHASIHQTGWDAVAMFPADLSVPVLPSLSICLAEGGDENMQMRGGSH